MKLNLQWAVRIWSFEIQRTTTAFSHLKVKFKTAINTRHQNVPVWIELTTEHSIYRWSNSSSVRRSTCRRVIVQLGQIWTAVLPFWSLPTSSFIRKVQLRFIKILVIFFWICITTLKTGSFLKCLVFCLLCCITVDLFNNTNIIFL